MVPRIISSHVFWHMGLIFLYRPVHRQYVIEMPLKWRTGCAASGGFTLLDLERMKKERNKRYEGKIGTT